MSKGLSKKKLYSVKDWKDADILGRIEIALINPEYYQLTGDDEVYYLKMRKTFHVLADCNSELRANRLLRDIFPSMDNRTIYKLISDTQKHFSKIIERNVEFDRIIQSDRILRHIEIARADGEHGAVARLEALYADIRGTNKQAESNFKWSELTLPEVEESSDVSVLFQEAEIDDDK